MFVCHFVFVIIWSYTLWCSWFRPKPNFNTNRFFLPLSLMIVCEQDSARMIQANSSRRSHRLAPPNAYVCLPWQTTWDHGYTVQTFNSCTSRPDVCQYLIVQTHFDNMSKCKPSTPMTHVTWRTKLRSVVRSSMLLYPRNLVIIGRAVVYYARSAHAFSAGIKYQHCTKALLYWLWACWPAEW